MGSNGHYEARVKSEQIPGGRVACLRPNPQGIGMGQCANCGKDLRFDPEKFETVVEVACSTECAKEAGFYPEREAWVEPEEREKRGPKETCPSCGGPARGRGFTHTEDCEAKNHKVEDAPSEDNHTDMDIPDKPKPEPKPPRENCPVCGGPPWKRGWKHTDDCTNSAKAKVAAAAEAKRAERANGNTPKAKRKPRGIFDD
jgi:hypothetical protein